MDSSLNDNCYCQLTLSSLVGIACLLLCLMLYLVMCNIMPSKFPFFVVVFITSILFCIQIYSCYGCILLALCSFWISQYILQSTPGVWEKKSLEYLRCYNWNSSYIAYKINPNISKHVGHVQVSCTCRRECFLSVSFNNGIWLWWYSGFSPGIVFRIFYFVTLNPYHGYVEGTASVFLASNFSGRSLFHFSLG